MRLLLAPSLIAIATFCCVTISAAEQSSTNASGQTSNSAGSTSSGTPAAQSGFEHGDMHHPYISASSTEGSTGGGAGSTGGTNTTPQGNGAPPSAVMFNPKEYSISKAASQTTNSCATQPAGAASPTCGHGPFHPDTHGPFHPATHGPFHPDTHGG